jgi:hypothetical protein
LYRFSIEIEKNLLKYTLIGITLVGLIANRQRITDALSSWTTDKLNFKILKVSDFRFDPFTSNLSFNLSFSLDNFLPLPFTITSMMLTVYKAIGVDENNIVQWEKIAERNHTDSTRTINIDPGENTHKVNITSPITTSLPSVFAALTNRVLGTKSTYRVDVEAQLQGNETLPIHESIIIEA